MNLIKNRENLLSYILNALLLIIVTVLSLRLVHMLFDYLLNVLSPEGFDSYNEISEADGKMSWVNKSKVNENNNNNNNKEDKLENNNNELLEDESLSESNDDTVVNEVAKEIQKVMDTRQLNEKDFTPDNSKKIDKLEKVENVKDQFVDLDPLEIKSEKSAVPMTVENYQFKTVYQKLDEVNRPSKTMSVKEICGMTGKNKDKVDGCLACKVNHRENEFKVNENDSGTNIMNICQYKNGHKSLYKNKDDVWTREECVAKCSTIPDYI